MTETNPIEEPIEGELISEESPDNALEQELEEMRDKWLRAEAEVANVRARARKDVEDARQYATQKFAKDIVEVAETLSRGLDSLPIPVAGENDIIAKIRDGFCGVERVFLATLERNGVKREDPTGTCFDPNLHQAISEQENSEVPSGTVLTAMTHTWTLNGRLLRPAMVIVSK